MNLLDLPLSQTYRAENMRGAHESNANVRPAESSYDMFRNVFKCSQSAGLEQGEGSVT